MVPAFRHVLIFPSWGSAALGSWLPSLSDFRGATHLRGEAGQQQVNDQTASASKIRRMNNWRRSHPCGPWSGIQEIGMRASECLKSLSGFDFARGLINDRGNKKRHFITLSDPEV
jgi:hypothetical protein